MVWITRPLADAADLDADDAQEWRKNLSIGLFFPGFGRGSRGFQDRRLQPLGHPTELKTHSRYRHAGCQWPWLVMIGHRRTLLVQA